MVCIEHCPTAEMIADFFTKPLQGQKFKDFRFEVLEMQLLPAPVRSGRETVQEVAGVAWLRASLIGECEGGQVGRRHAVDVFDEFRKKKEKE